MKTRFPSARVSAVLLLALFLPLVAAPAADEAALKAEIEAVRKATIERYKDRLPDNFEDYVRETGTRNYHQRQFTIALTNGNAIALAGVFKEFPEFARPQFLNSTSVLGKQPLVYAVERGHREVVELLLAQKVGADAPRPAFNSPFWSGSFGPSSTGYPPGYQERRDTPLHAAVRAGNLEIARTLLAAGAGIEALDSRGESPLHICVRALCGPANFYGLFPPGSEAWRQQEKLLSLLLQHGASVLSTNRFVSATGPLSAALQSRSEAVLDQLLSKSIHLSATNAAGETLVHLAVMQGRTNALQVLLARQAPTTNVAASGFTPLRQASWLPVVPQLPTPFFHGAGYTALDSMTRAGFLRQHSADLLLAAGAQADALVLAGLNRTNELAALLRREPAQASARDPQERTPLHYAVNAHSSEALQLLLRAGAPTEARNKAGETPLLQALANHRSRLATNLLAAGAKVTATNAAGQTPLHLAVGGGDTNLFATLIASGADINARDHAGKTALELAAISQRFDLVQWLEARGAAAAPRAERLMTTPLHQAVAQGNQPQMMKLLTNGADVNARNEQGLTPLALAVGAGRADLALTLLTNGADVNLADTNGFTPLRARLFAANDPVPNPVPKPGFSKRPPAPSAPKTTATRADTLPPELRPPALTAQSAVTNLLLLLLENGANPKLLDAKGNTILHALHPSLPPGYDYPPKPTYPPLPEAIARVRLLVNYGLSPDTRATNGLTPLHVAAAQASLVHAFALLEVGVGVNTPDLQGRTALHHALLPPASRWQMQDVIFAHRDRPHVLALLLDNGADLRRTDTNGATALHLLPAMNDTLRDLVLPALKTNRHFAAALRVKNKAGQTPVLLAFEQLRARPVAPVVKLLTTFLSSGGELPPVTERGGTSLLHELAGIGANQADAATIAFLAPLSAAAVAKAGEVDVRNAKGETPLHVATRQQNVPFATALLARGASPNAQDAQGDTPLHLALRNLSPGQTTHPVIPLLVSNKCDILLRNVAGESPLRMEVSRRFYQGPLFLPPGATQGFFPAARAGDLASLDAYLALDPTLATLADPTTQTSALRSAALTGQQEVAERLRNAGASDPVSAAVLGWTNSLTVFVHGTPHLGETNFGVGMPLLHLAASRGQTAAVRILLTESVSPGVEDFFGRTALYHSTTNGTASVTALLMARGLQRSLFDTIALADAPGLKALLVADAQRANATNQLGRTPLLQAVERGQLEIVQTLLAHGANPDRAYVPMPRLYMDGFLGGTVPLHLAVWSNRVDVAEALVSAKASLAPQNARGYSALHFAVARGHREMTAWLLARGADPNVQSVVAITTGPGMFPPTIPHQLNAGWTPLHLAVSYGHPALIELLVAKGAKLDVTDSQGRTPADLTQRTFGMMGSQWTPSPYLGFGLGLPIVDASRDPARMQAVVEVLKKLGAVLPTTRGASFSSPVFRPGVPFPPNIPVPPPGAVPPVKK